MTTLLLTRACFATKLCPLGLRTPSEMLAQLIGVNIKVNVDDMLVESQVTAKHIVNPDECFKVLRACHMKLNHAKCSFGDKWGKFM